ERDDFNEEQALHDTPNVRLGQLPDEFRVLAGILNACVAKDLQPRALRVVHEEQRNPIVGREIACGEHLALATKVAEAQRGRAEHTQESRLAATMLHIRPTGLRDRRNVKGIAGGNELAFLVRERITFLGGSHSGAATVVTLLRREHRWREHDSFESIWHNFTFS